MDKSNRNQGFSMERYLSVRQAAERLSVSPRTIRRYIEQNILPAYRVVGSNTIRIKDTDLEALLRPVNSSAHSQN